MASFQAKIWGETVIKTIVLFHSNLTRKRKFQKNRKKFKKTKKIPFSLHLKPNQVGKGRERKKTKIIVPFRSYPTHNRKFQKNRKKIPKI